MAIVIPASSLVAQDYQPLEIKNIRPADILPIVGQVEAWDKKVYNRIEHLRIAEATRIRDMMRKNPDAIAQALSAWLKED